MLRRRPDGDPSSPFDYHRPAPTTMNRTVSRPRRSPHRPRRVRRGASKVGRRPGTTTQVAGRLGSHRVEFSSLGGGEMARLVGVGVVYEPNGRWIRVCAIGCREQREDPFRLVHSFQFCTALFLPLLGLLRGEAGSSGGCSRGQSSPTSPAEPCSTPSPTRHLAVELSGRVIAQRLGPVPCGGPDGGVVGVDEIVGGAVTQSGARAFNASSARPTRSRSAASAAVSSGESFFPVA